MSVREQAEQEAVDERSLPDDDLPHLPVQRRDPARRVLHALLELADLAGDDGADRGGDAVGLLDGLCA